MANRFDWNALEAKIELTMQENVGLANRTEALTALALSTILEVGIDDGIDSLTDGSNDRGVDALYIDDSDGHSDVHIIQTKCTSCFEKSKNNFPGSEVDKIASFISDLTDADTDALRSVNPRLGEKIADALSVLTRTNATITVHFVGNMASLVADEVKRIGHVFKKYAAIKFEMHNLDNLSEYFLTKNAPSIDREFTAIDTNFFARTDLNLRGMVCTVAASELVEALRSEENPELVELGIFDQNVRVFLKRSNKINTRIIESALADDNHMFWYQNNGITMTCDKIDIAPSKRSPKIGLTNVQIVNGGQTSNCIFEAAKADASKIEDVLLLIRIIETTNTDVKLSIAESTNSQTPINVRDLRANDRQQRQFEESFADIGYFYERKTNQHADKPKDKRIDALTAGQAYLAYGIGLPEVAKKDRGRVFGNLYDTVFSDDLTAERLLTSNRLIDEINYEKAKVRAKIRKKIALANGEMSMIDGAFHILFAIHQINIRDEIDVWDFDAAKKSIEEAIAVVGYIYDVNKEQDTNFSSNQFFKDSRTRDKITLKVG